MPTYRYRCPHCHECFEVDRNISEYSEVEQCPNCSGTAKRVFTPIGTIPCDGFYNKDSRGK